jgi:hypothetical protein
MYVAQPCQQTKHKLDAAQLHLCKDTYIACTTHAYFYKISSDYKGEFHAPIVQVNRAAHTSVVQGASPNSRHQRFRELGLAAGWQHQSPLHTRSLIRPASVCLAG